jgi:hypothetical protein
VYEPHLAPKLERWAEQYVTRRKAKKHVKEGMVVVPIHVDLGEARRSNGSISKHSDDSSDDDDAGDTASVKLEKLVAEEVNEWRNGGDEQIKSTLRHRKNPGGVALDEVCSAFQCCTSYSFSN